MGVLSRHVATTNVLCSLRESESIVAIGSAPEIGTQFTTWGQMSEQARAAWFEHMRTSWGPGLVGGYGTLVQIDRTTGEQT